ncbi:hypothetical protein F5H01DRAFT_371643 [Linnemannia elongata]|nr:hypothetical protein F5H01DRAFT_371643 [Linnemannia elongata]
MPPQPHALDLPEILALISQHLTHKDLYACIQVCHSFHLSFAPHLWSTILVQRPNPPKCCIRFPSQQAMTRYKYLIQTLHLLEVFPHNYLTAFEDTLRELHVTALYNARYDSGIFNGTFRHILRTITMNANSLRHLKVNITIPDQSDYKQEELWEALAQCRQVRTLEIGNLSLSLWTMGHFWEICGADYSGGGGDSYGAGHSLALTTSLPQRSVALNFCVMNEWTDDLCDDESFTLPFITSLNFDGKGPRNKECMSNYAQGRLIQRCQNLRCLTWSGGDDRADLLRAKRWNYQSRSMTDWFFAGLLGDISKGPERHWRIVERMDDDTGGATGALWPYLETIDLPWKNISDFTSARLLRRLYRLETLRWRNPLLSHLTMEELFRKRVPLQWARDPAHPSSLLSPPPPLAARAAPMLSYKLCTTLKILDLSFSRLIPSDDIHQVLESCPVLEEFRTGIVDMSNILSRPEWVCRGIRKLFIGIVFSDPSSSTAAAAATASTQSTITTSTACDSPSTTATATAATPTAMTTKELERAVFARLAQLNRIKSFFHSSRYAPPDAQILQLKVGHGLELLSGWGGSIEDLSFSSPNMEMDDARWIIDHWPTLKKFAGSSLNADVGIDKQIWKTFTSHGIKREYN